MIAGNGARRSGPAATIGKFVALIVVISPHFVLAQSAAPSGLVVPASSASAMPNTFAGAVKSGLGEQHPLSPPVIPMSGDSRISLADQSDSANLSADRIQAGRLSRNIPAVDFVSTPFGQVMKFLSDTIGVRIVIDDRGLQDADIETDAKINLHLKNISGDIVLEWVLRQVSGVWLDYEIEAGIVRICTSAALNGRGVTTCTYDVGDLLSTLASPPSTTRSPTGPGTDLVRLITDFVAPDSWRDNGGDIGVAVIEGTNLVVTQNRAGQRGVATLLTQLRRPEAPAN